MGTPDVLICGEVGTGKGSLAEALARGPLAVLDCRMPPAVLVESMLFGHVRSNCFGPGGPTVRRGLLEWEGTVVLDELAAIPAELHAKIARALATRQLRRVGENRAVPVGATVIATSATPDAIAPVLRERFVEQRVAPVRERLAELAPDLPRSLIARLAPLCLDLAAVRRIAIANDPVAIVTELELLAAIAASPGDDDPRRVYADLLLARDEVLGELIHIQCELARHRSRRLAGVERRLLAAYGTAWLAPVLAIPHVTSAVLRRGFIEIVRGTQDLERVRDQVRRVAPLAALSR